LNRFKLGWKNLQNSFIGTRPNVSLFQRRLPDEQILTVSGDDSGLKRNQLRNFKEKMIRRTQKDKKPASYNSEEKTIILTILVALVIMFALLGYMVFFTPAQKEPFTALYLLDSAKQLENIPRTVVLGKNSTFLLWIGVENQNDSTIEYSVRVSLKEGNYAQDSNTAELLESFNRTLADGKTWEFPVTISIDQLGSHMIIFELLFFNKTENEWEQTGNWINLSIEAVEAI
jgi:uncharacterized membrane protein